MPNVRYLLLSRSKEKCAVYSLDLEEVTVRWKAVHGAEDPRHRSTVGACALSGRPGPTWSVPLSAAAFTPGLLPHLPFDSIPTILNLLGRSQSSSEPTKIYHGPCTLLMCHYHAYVTLRSKTLLRDGATNCNNSKETLSTYEQRATHMYTSQIMLGCPLFQHEYRRFVPRLISGTTRLKQRVQSTVGLTDKCSSNELGLRLY